MRPDQFASKRRERLKREGPYTILAMGASGWGVTDLPTTMQYSLGRLLETDLRESFGYIDRIRVDVMTRIYWGQGLHQSIDKLMSYVETGLQVDCILLEINQLGEWFLTETLSKPENLTDLLIKLDRLSFQYDTKIVFVDDYGLMCMFQEGLDPSPSVVGQFLAEMRKAGYESIEPTNELIREYLEVSPWGSPPYDGTHTSP